MDQDLYNLNHLFEAISQKIFKTDLNTHKPPFLPFSFAEWRAEAYETLETSLNKMDLSRRQEIKRKFINRVDGELLYQFTKKMRQPYFDLVFFDNYAIPSGLDFQAARKDYLLFKDLEELASQITEWCIQIEISADLVERAELYNYFACEKSEKEIYKELKTTLEGKSKTSIGQKLKSALKSSLTYSIKSLSSFIWTKGLALSNISMGALILLYYSVIGTSSLPFQLLMPNIRLSWFLGGIFGSFALNKVAESIERGEVANNLQKVIAIYKQITLNLCDFNTTCENTLKDCVLAKTEEELTIQCLKLKKIIRDVLDNAETLASMHTTIEKQRNVVEREDDSDDDLTLLELEDIKASQNTQYK